MTKFKTLSAVMILSAAIATPVFAQDADVQQPSPATHVRSHDRSNYRSAYNQSNAAVYAAPRRDADTEDFGFSGRDPSRVGGEDPDLRPAGN
ncbi:hypothetical protein [Bradyrhizobium sp.]|jgi:hypothetical protein|uniref:hypothetical protein n=1 Tax=Bradyrhizobium sp. TaxID=376 RepID=UPI003D10648A